MRLLATREHSRVELSRKLTPHAASAEELNQLLDELGARGFQNDARVADALVHARSPQQGMSRLRQTLQSKGIAESDIAPALQDLASTEHDRAWALWQKRFGRLGSAPCAEPDSGEDAEATGWVGNDDDRHDGFDHGDGGQSDNLSEEDAALAQDGETPPGTWQNPQRSVSSEIRKGSAGSFGSRWAGRSIGLRKPVAPSAKDLARQAEAKAYAKQSRFLLSRGFSSDVVRATLQRGRLSVQDDVE